MGKSPDEIPPLSSADLLDELLTEVRSTRQTAAQASLQAARAVQLIASSQQLDARQRFANVDIMEKFARTTKKFELAVERMLDRPASLTVVQDTPRDEDVTRTFLLGQPWVGVDLMGKRIPSKWVARGFVIGVVVFGVLMVLLGMGLTKAGIKPREVVRAAAPLVAP